MNELAFKRGVGLEPFPASTKHRRLLSTAAVGIRVRFDEKSAGDVIVVQVYDQGLGIHSNQRLSTQQFGGRSLIYTITIDHKTRFLTRDPIFGRSDNLAEVGRILVRQVDYHCGGRHRLHVEQTVKDGRYLGNA